jgi:anti-sigma-K factor RskA
MSDGKRQIWDEASVGEYALGVMPHAERLRFAADLKTDNTLQMRVANWDENFAPMASELADIAPPPMVLSKIEARLFPVSPSTAKPVSLFQRLGFWQAATAVGFAGLAMVVALPRLNPTPVAVAPVVAVIQGETILLSASFNSAENLLSISRKRGTEAANEDFEIWVIAEGAAPVSLGVLQAGETTNIKLASALKQVILGSTLAVTNEPDGGSPTGKPTGTVLGSGIVLKI